MNKPSSRRVRNNQRLHDRKVALLSQGQGAIAVTPLNSVESTAMFSDILSGRQARFGARRLLGRDLCSEHTLGEEQVRQLASQYCLRFAHNRCSFIQISALLHRDPITYSLFTAGALPFPILRAEKLATYLGSLQSCYVVWLINTFFSLCQQSSATGSEVLSLRCGHALSKSDYWLRCVLGRGRFDDIRCCECGRHILSAEEEERRRGSTSSSSLSECSPTEVAQASLTRFLLLPVEKNKRSRPQFAAMPFFELNASFIGYYQEKRKEKFEAACVEGNTNRVLEMVRCGVDVNFRNEYGQTALFVAVWRGHEETAAALKMSGADESIVDNSDCGPPLLHQQPSPPPAPLRGSVTTLIERDECGLGSYVLDNFISDEIIFGLIDNFSSLPVAPADKASCSRRSYFCDASQRFVPAINAALAAARAAAPGVCSSVLPFFRYLHYEFVGGRLPAHVDLCRSDFDGRPSTHTFILYLTDTEGGETQLLRRFPRPHLPPELFAADQAEAVIESVQPRRGRVFIFPHLTVHCGQPLLGGRKLLLRGEAY